MPSSAIAEVKRVLLALAAGATITFLPRLVSTTGGRALSLPAYFVLLPGGLLTAFLGRHKLAELLGANAIIWAAIAYLVLRYSQKRRAGSRGHKPLGFMNETLSQERAPVFTAISVLASLLICVLMLGVYAESHAPNLGFGALAILPMYGLLAFTGILVKVIFGSIATARGEAYAGRVEAVSASVCTLAALLLIQFSFRPHP